MEEFKNGDELYELLLLCDNITLEIKDNGGMDKELGERLYNVYEAMSAILKGNLNISLEELYKNPSAMRKYNHGELQTIYDNSSSEVQRWLLNNLYQWSNDVNNMK